MSNKIRNFLNLLRVRQYYKNTMIFVGIFFSERLLETDLYFNLLIGFILLCLSSSFNYIINDIRDVENDRKHPEKIKKKPLASGDISITFAVLLLIIIAGIVISSLIFLIRNLGFVFMIISIIITGQLYNHLFKYYAFIDILILSTGYLWRALAGCAIIEEYVSAWLFLAIFELAMFLSIAKRKGDLNILGKDEAIGHKKIYDQYSLKLLDQFHIIIAGSLFMTYSLYLLINFSLINLNSTETPNANFHEYISIFTIPISLYIIMRYMYLTSTKPEIARNTEKAFMDKGIIIASAFLFVILLFSFYFDVFLDFFKK